MMKTRLMVVATMAAVFAFVPVSQASRIDEGTLEVGGSANLEFVNAYGANFDMNLLGGYFIRNGILLGGRAQTYIQRDYTMIGAFLTVEQHLELEYAWVPYLGTDLGVAFVNFTDGDPHQRHSPDGVFSVYNWSDNENNRAAALVVVLRGGVKYYLTESLALDTSLNVSLASARIYAQKNREPGNVDVAIRVGLRYNFDTF